MLKLRVKSAPGNVPQFAVQVKAEVDGHFTFYSRSVQKFRLPPVLKVRANSSDVQTFVAVKIYRLHGFVQRDHELQKLYKRALAQQWMACKS